jgi:hypothetical protein
LFGRFAGGEIYAVLEAKEIANDNGGQQRQLEQAKVIFPQYQNERSA